jgi:hypothetical protein
MYFQLAYESRAAGLLADILDATSTRISLCSFCSGVFDKRTVDCTMATQIFRQGR